MSNRSVRANRANYTRSNSRLIIDPETFASVRAEKLAAKKAKLIEKFTPAGPTKLSITSVFEQVEVPVRHLFTVPVRIEKKVLTYEEASMLSFEEKRDIMSRAFEMSMSGGRKPRLSIRYAAGLIFVVLLLAATTAIGFNNLEMNHEVRAMAAQR